MSALTLPGNPHRKDHPTTMTRRLVAFAAFVLCVAAANAALNRWGIVKVPPRVGLDAPAGVYAAGLAFGLRDALHELAGRRWVLAAIAAGAGLSLALEGTATIPGGWVPIAVASAIAFAVSELLDLAVYEPLRSTSWPLAVVASNAVGAAADSTLFLVLAFGSLDHLAGQYLGKLLMVAPALVIVGGIRHRALPRHRLEPASP